MIVFWFFFDFNAAIILFGLWGKVEFGDGFVVFENGLVVGARCFFTSVESAKRCLLAINSKPCLVSLPTLGHTRKEIVPYLLSIVKVRGLLYLRMA